MHRRPRAMKTSTALSAAAVSTVVAACSFVAYKHYRGEPLQLSLPKVVRKP